MPKVSIIIPCYNHKLFLKERLDSIFNQTYQDFEVILLDDASKDGSVALLEKYSSDKRVSHFIVNDKNSGSPFKQWKKGIDLSKGKYIWIAESDDTCDLNFLEEQLKELQYNDITVAKTLILTDGINTSEELHNHFHTTFKTNFLKPEHFIDFCPIGNVSSVVFKKEILISTSINYSLFDVIGDMMFYFENFRDKKIVYNTKTNSYFRRNTEGISNLSKKDISYYEKYFKEHLFLQKRISKILPEKYKEKIKNSLTRRFNKIKNRLSLSQKINFTYLYLIVIFLFNKKNI